MVFKEPAPPPPLTLAATIGYGERTRWRQIGPVHLTYFEDDPEPLQVCIVRKRKLHVITDQMLRARADTETAPKGRLSGLNLNLYPV